MLQRKLQLLRELMLRMHCLVQAHLLWHRLAACSKPCSCAANATGGASGMHQHGADAAPDLVDNHVFGCHADQIVVFPPDNLNGHHASDLQILPGDVHIAIDLGCVGEGATDVDIVVVG